MLVVLPLQNHVLLALFCLLAASLIPALPPGSFHAQGRSLQKYYCFLEALTDSELARMGMALDFEDLLSRVALHAPEGMANYAEELRAQTLITSALLQHARKNVHCGFGGRAVEAVCGLVMESHVLMELTCLVLPQRSASSIKPSQAQQPSRNMRSAISPPRSGSLWHFAYHRQLKQRNLSDARDARSWGPEKRLST